MTVFRVGQRVRIKWSDSWPELAGEAAVIVEVGCYASDHPSAGKWCWIVKPDSWPSKKPPIPSNYYPKANCFGAVEDQLEPLTDSNQLVSWESMRDLWVPEHMRVAA